MRTVTVNRRYPSSPQGIVSDLITDNGFKCLGGELPDYGDKPDISCVKGHGANYQGKWMFSEDHGMYLYHVLGDPNRTGVEIHAGNVMGDVSLNYQSDVLGCLILGEETAVFPTGTVLTPIHKPMVKPQIGITNSQTTLLLFHKAMQDANGNQEDFILTIN